MQKAGVRILSCVISGIISCSMSIPSLPPTMTYAAQHIQTKEDKSEISWKFCGSGNNNITKDGIQLSGSGDNFGISTISKKNNYSVKAKLDHGEESGVIGVVLGVKKENDPKEGAVVANVNPESGAVRLFCFQGHSSGDMKAEKIYTELKNKDAYIFEATVKQRHLTVKINNVKVVDMEISDTSFEGKVGFISFNDSLKISDFSVEDIDVKEATSHLTDLKIEGGKLDKEFSQNSKSYAVTVDNSVQKLSFTPKVSSNGTVTIGGKTACSEKSTEIALNVGSQEIPIVVTSDNGTTETTTIYALRNAKDSVYSVPTRPQYHFSQAKGWSNDPNGMLYYKGEWHLFFQHNQERTTWGSLEWGHAVSKDLIHWKELPRPLKFQEDNGAMFSGCGVVDDKNTSGLFGDEKGEGKGGLVIIYTQDNPGRGQDQCLAYSKDNGRTWTKYEGNPILKWNEDPLDNTAFRDPKVFWHEESQKWMMVAAGGILRIYSSDDLINWEVESTYESDKGTGEKKIETECPDMYPLKTDDGKTKWVVSWGGRFYSIGDFKKVDGKWRFIADADNHKRVMNFGPQSYAAMTYDNAPDDRRIMINWASTWENGYCNNVDSVTGQWGYNGFFNLQTELNVKKVGGKYTLIQTPIREYKTLRNEEAKVTVDKTIPKKTNTSQNLLSGVKAGQYEIVAEFTPKEDTKEVGFKLRTNEAGNKGTIVKYDVKTKKVILNGDKAGTIPEGQRKGDIVSDAIVIEEDGKVKLEIFVDESIVEVYGQDGQVSGALTIFPTTNSTGMEVYSEGGETDAKITVYPMKSIWEDKISSDKTATDLFLRTDSGSGEYGIGDNFDVMASISPMGADQKVTWKVKNNRKGIVKVEKEGNDTLTLKALKKGVVTVSAATANGLERSIDVYVGSSGLNSNIGDWNVIQGDWSIDENGYTVDVRDKGDGFAMSASKIDSNDYIYEADVTIHDGQAFALLFRGQNADSNKAYAANVHQNEGGNLDNDTSRIFTFGGGTGDIGKRVNYTMDYGKRYHLKVEVKGNQFKFYINGSLVLDRVDRKISSNYVTGQYVGLNAFDSKVSFQNIKVTPIVIKDPTATEKLSLYTGQKNSVKVDADENDDFKLIKYSSSDSSVAEIDEDGNVTAKKAGKADIISKVTLYGRTYTLKTKIDVKTPYVKVTAPTSMYRGKKVQLRASGVGVSGIPTWSVSSKKYATINSKGVLTAKAAGSIMVTAKIRKYTKKVQILIKKPYIKLSYKKSVKRAKTYKFKAKSYGTGKSVSWSLSRKSKKYASISKKGTLKTKKKKAKITIYVKSGNVTKKLKVRIN